LRHKPLQKALENWQGLRRDTNRSKKRWKLAGIKAKFVETGTNSTENWEKLRLKMTGKYVGKMVQKVLELGRD
jgi:hypothetical protein